MGRAGRPERTRPAPTSPLAPQIESVTVAGRQEVVEAPGAGNTPSLAATAALAPRAAEPRESGSTGVPKYLTLERKDARLRGDQVEDLSMLARRLSSRRRQREERITDNTLIRVAVDLLLQHADQLHGDTEDALRNSVTTALQKPSGQD